MTTKQFKFRCILLSIIIGGFTSNSWSQAANVTYKIKLESFKAEFDPCSDAGKQVEAGNFEWTGFFECKEKYQDQPGYFNRIETDCYYCDSNGDCVFDVQDDLLSSNTTDHGNLYVSLVAWENDPNAVFDDGNRCHVRGEDDDNVGRSGEKEIYYRLESFPSNEIYTYYNYNIYTDYTSRIGCNSNDIDKVLSYTWGIKTTWKYTGSANLLTPTCTPQTASYLRNFIPSWSVSLTAGVEYFFSNCGDFGFDSYIRLYDSDGYTLLSSNDNFCGTGSKIVFRPNTSGIYYLELTGAPRTNVPNFGYIAYGINLPSNDLCQNATVLVSGIAKAYQTLCSSQDGPNQSCGGINDHYDVWFKYTTASEGELIIDNCSRNDYNSRISVYTGTCGNLNLIESSCHDQSCGAGNYASGIRINSCKNTSYYISVGGVDGAKGTGLISLFFFPNPGLPTILCPADMTVGLAPGTCNNTNVNYTAPVGTDNCPGAITTQISGLGSGSIFPSGYTTNIFKVTDASSNTNTCSFTILVQDTEKPIATCNPTVTVNASSSTCSATATYAAATATDNCGVDRIERIAGLGSGQLFPVGTTQIIYLITDIYNNSVTCVTPIRVRDVTLPSISCPPNITNSTNINSCKALIGFAGPTVSDNCSVNYTLQSGIAAGSEFPIGVTTNIYKATDASGNTNTCSMTITVQDLQKPSITCPPNIIAELNSQTSCSQAVHFPDASFSDNCSLYPVIVTTSVPSGSAFQVGNHQVVFTATDFAGNTNTCTLNITVKDKGIPFIFCPEDQIVHCPSTVAFPPVNYFDYCGLATRVQISGPVSGSYFSSAETAVVFQVSDVAGNTNTCSFKIKVQNVGDFILDCPDDIDVELNSTASCFQNVVFPNPTAIGDCIATPIQFSTSQISGSQFPVGTTPIIFTATDANGITKECSFNINVHDPFKPIISCPNNIYLECPGELSFPMATAVDNCSQTQVYQTKGPLSGSYFNPGESNIVFESMDESGNTSTCSFIIQVENSKPFENLVLEDIVIGACSGTPPTPSILTQCSGQISATTNHGFPITDQGSTLVIWNFDDNMGHQVYITQNVIVKDLSAPVPDQQILPTIQSECSIVVDPPTATDACTGMIIGTTTDPIEYHEQGSYTISWIFNDGNNNFTNQEQIVIIKDVSPPVKPELPDLVLTPCSTLLERPSTIDQCAGIILGTTNSQFPLSTSTTISWTFNDGHGNESQAFQNIIIEVPNLPGKYLDLGNCEMTLCPPGTYCPGATTSPIPCAAGKYQNLFGQTTCTNCPPGSYSDNTGSISCASCPAGKFQNVEGQTNCLNCPQGSYSNVPGSINCASCPAGKFQNVEGQTSCLNCPQGSYSNVTGSINCVSCPAGKFQNLQGQTTCINCPPGAYSSANGSINCTACPVQTYNPISGANHCLDCPQGTYNPTIGAIICPDCNLSLICVNPVPVNTDAGTCTASNLQFSEPLVNNNCPIASLTHNGPTSFAVGSTVIRWTATDVSGNTSSCNQTIQVKKWGDPQSLYAYTILSNDEVKLKENLVESGGVGVIGNNKKISLEKNTKIIAQNTFVKSKEIDIKSGSEVTTKIVTAVPSSIKPDFIENQNPSNNKIKTNDNSAPITLNLNSYGEIELGKNSIATVSGHSKVFIKELKLKEGSQLKFSQTTEVIIAKGLDANESVRINPNSNFSIQFYVDSDVKIDKGSVVNANIYTQKKIKLEKASATNRTYMTGQFIADKVEADEYVTWNWDPSYCKIENQGSALKVQDNGVLHVKESIEEVVLEKSSLQLHPNPASHQIYFTIEEAGTIPVTIQLYNNTGMLLEQHSYSADEINEQTLSISLQNYKEGLYYLKAIVQGKPIVKYFLVIR